jgi:hypothetical protein
MRQRYARLSKFFAAVSFAQLLMLVVLAGPQTAWGEAKVAPADPLCTGCSGNPCTGNKACIDSPVNATCATNCCFCTSGNCATI